MAAGPAVRRVILIGAARSGTKVLRDSLARATGAGAVPYDIGYVWRTGAGDHPDDVLDPRCLKQRDRRVITTFVDKYASGSPPAVIEKTVGNAVRVPFVAAVFPDATFVHLVRDGIDVTESTFRQWKEPADSRYLLQKARHFPLRMVPGYGRRYVVSALRRRLAPDGRVASWGPRYPGMDADLAAGDLLGVCARQWRESVVRARRDLEAAAVPFLDVRYEDLVQSPAAQIARIAEFCALPVPDESLAAAVSMVRPGSSGRGRRSLDAGQMQALEVVIGDVQAELGYPRPLEVGLPDAGSTA